MKNQVSISKVIRIAMALALSFAILSTAAFAEELKEHNPYVVRGVQLRSNLLAQLAPGSPTVSLGPLVFQEIIPCRFVSTLEADHYPAEWGGPAFQVNESRTYHPLGVIRNATFTNPCSELIPAESVAVALRVESPSPRSTGDIYLTPGAMVPVYEHSSKLALRAGQALLAEATVVLQNYSFTVTSANVSTDMTIDIIGFFIPDPWGAGGKGDKGDRGERGEQGLQGVQGAKGDQGARGEQGLKGDDGAKGDKGDRGEQGLQGAKGDQGERGAQGLKGDDGAKGDRGERGEQGLKGDKGDRGDRGEQGLKGDKGDRGDRGEAGPQGLKGDKGENGAQGPMGPMGPQGPQGPKGDKGDAGTGGVTMSSGSGTFPPPGNLTIYNQNCHSNSVIMLVYKDVSNGNALAVVSQSEGVFTVSGSPNKPFRYVILNQPAN